jgi:two-component system NtrC family sensor kinase
MMNAFDAMHKGGNLWVRSHCSSDSGQVELRVRDDGSGIAPEILSHIFEPFLTTKESGHGVGLGLAISHGIIERHNGRIEVQSEIGKGTTFIITLPVSGSVAVSAPAPAALTGAAAR